MATMTVEAYIEGLPKARREAIEALRACVVGALPEGYEEGIQYGAIGYYVPHSLCPDGYHCDPKQPVPFLGLASRKAGISLSFFGLYIVTEVKERFVTGWQESGHKLDMGASCVRIKKLEQVPLEVIAEAVASLPVEVFLECYEQSVPAKARKKRAGFRA